MRDVKATPMVPRPAWVPTTGPMSPTTISPAIVRAQHLDELVDVAAVGVEHGEVVDPAVVLGDLVDEELERLRRVRCLPPCSTAPSTTSMIGLIASAVASIALAPPMRPPFFRLSSVSSAPNTLVRAARSAASAATSSRLAPLGGAAGAGDGDGARRRG